MKNYNNEIKLQETLLYQENIDNLTPNRIMEFVRHFYNVQRPRYARVVLDVELLLNLKE